MIIFPDKTCVNISFWVHLRLLTNFALSARDSYNSFFFLVNPGGWVPSAALRG